MDNMPVEIADGSIAAYAEAAMAETPAITAASEQSALLKSFIADNPVIQTAEEAQKAGAWIESTRKTLASLEDERKPKVGPLNDAIKSINDSYRAIREPLEKLLTVIRGRFNKWDADERARREAEAERVRLEAEEAARKAQELIDEANEAIADAEAGICTDAGTAVVDAQDAMRAANKLDRAAGRAERATNVRVASTLGGKALASRSKRIIVIDDPVAAVKAIGCTEKIAEAIKQSAKTFEEIHGELPAGVHATIERSI
ncbi:MAG: hypothetical protein ACRELF_22575, partial [Gemmataceae bacterium]